VLENVTCFSTGVAWSAMPEPLYDDHTGLRKPNTEVFSETA
jgi:hypothetical protein